MKTVRHVNVIVHVKHAADAACGQTMFDIILDSLTQYDEVVIYFTGIRVATPSFINAAFCPLLDHFSFDEIKQRLQIKDSTKQINDLLKERMKLASDKRGGVSRGTDT